MVFMFRIYSFLFLIVFDFQILYCQKESITLDSCLIWAQNNYPMIKQLDLVKSTESFSLSNIATAWFPQINVTGQASYQSDVTGFKIAIPGINLPEPPSKEQYKFYADFGQLVYAGGSIIAQKNLVRSNTKLEILKLEVEFYKINDRILQLYFGSILIQEQLQIVDLIDKDLIAQIKKAEAALESQIIASSTLYQLQAESIKARQKRIELESQQNQMLKLLGQFINKELPINTAFIVPKDRSLRQKIDRSELWLSDQQVVFVENQWRLSRSKVIPKLSLFGQIGYANPALNFLKNEFQAYYVAGIRLNWNFSSLYSFKNDYQISILNKNIAALQKETFLFNTRLNLLQQEEEIHKFEILLKSDLELVELRTKIKVAAKVQWESGVITVSDYIRELNAEEQARTNQTVHQIQFLQAQYLHYYHSGIKL